MGWLLALCLYILGAITVAGVLLDALPNERERKARIAMALVVIFWPAFEIAAISANLIKAVRG